MFCNLNNLTLTALSKADPNTSTAWVGAPCNPSCEAGLLFVTILLHGDSRVIIPKAFPTETLYFPNKNL